jgi:pimeloyl-ACP methyl ester carboxylesterase
MAARWARWAVALAACAVGPGALAAAPAPDVVEHRVPIDAAGRVALRDLTDVLLRETSSAVSAPRDLDAGSVDLARLRSPAWMLAANLGLAPVGVGLRVEDGALIVRIDRDRLRGRVDQLETLLRAVFGRGPPVYALERIDGSSQIGPPVVLVHGLDSTVDRLRGAASAIARAGYDAYLFRYPDDGGVEATAAALGEQLQALHRARGRRIALVTVSMGGVIARTWLELDPRAGDEVERLIACVPPFAGSGIARYHLLSEISETVRDMLGHGFDGFFVFDGLGQGARDLVPGSSLLRRLAASKPRAGVRYSIVAGNRPIVEDAVFSAARSALRALGDGADEARRFAIALVGELVDEAARVSGGRGDGAVSLESQSMAGVSDRVVLPMSHFDALSGDGAAGSIPALADVVSRLPRP